MTELHDIKWGISTLGCHELDLPTTCDLADKHGIRYLEIRSLEDSLNLPEYLDEKYSDPDAPRSVLEQHHQSIVALNSGFSLINADEKAQKELLAFARWAEQLNIPYIRVFGGGSMDEPLSQDDWNTAVANLKWWHRHREASRWTTQIVLETHGGFSSSERCLKLKEAFDGPLEIIWDTHHTWKQGGESAQETWDQMGDSIVHVHIKDSVPVPSARHPYSYVLPGEGEFPVGDVYSVLNENNYHGVVSLEWERKWHPYMPDLDTALTALVSSGWKSGSIESVG